MNDRPITAADLAATADAPSLPLCVPSAITLAGLRGLPDVTQTPS